MIQAILAGQKTRTVQVMNPQPTGEPCDDSTMWHWKDCSWIEAGLGFPESGIEDYAMCKPGDIVCIRETWRPVDGYDDPIFLRITGVKVQRYRGLTGKETIAEGIDCSAGPERGVPLCNERWALKGKWKKIQNSHRTKKSLALLGDDANLWCFVYDFERAVPDDK